MKKAILVLVGLFIFLFVGLEWNAWNLDAQKSPTPLQGDNFTQETWQIKLNAPACREQDYFDRLVSFAGARDQQAYEKYLTQGIRIGQCRWLNKGQKIFIESGGLLSSKCVRIRGETDCWYTSQSFIEPAK